MKILICKRCGNKVRKNKYFDEKTLKTEHISIENYRYECLNCDENMFSFEVEEVVE